MPSLLRRPRPAPDGTQVATTPQDAGWRYVSFAARRLTAGAGIAGETRGEEVALIVLGGRCTVRGPEGELFAIDGRADVWARVPPHVVLLPPGSAYDVRADTDLHIAIAGAPAPLGGEVRSVPPGEMTTEVRGSGRTQRHIQHLLPPAAPAARLLLVEVYTPAGNWSSFPPHKHDTEDPPHESYLEEIYYYQVLPRTGFALQRVYTPGRELDETIAATDGDLVLVPRGYHTVAATPGHECYYLNVMAGPTRAWNFSLDPDYAHLMDWRKPEVAGGERG